MNIFILDNDIEKCVQYHVNRHNIKMITEHVQMLSTACRLSGLSVGYGATHKNHPCNIWVRESLSNWLWLRELTVCLNDEYKYRYDKSANHKSFDVMMALPIPELSDNGLTPFVQCMPDQYKCDDPVQAYRNYYIGEKQHIAKWTKRPVPEWYILKEKEK